MTEVLTTRVLNRATLHRQLLLGRATVGVAAAIEHLVGMQAQVPTAPYVGLWARLAGFAPQDLAAMVASHQVARIALMRSTLHLVTARDCLALREAVQPVLDRDLFRNSTFGAGIAGIGTAALCAAGRTLVETRSLTPKELGTLLAERWPGRDPASLAYAVRNLVPLVQVPPRGVWGRTGQARHTTAMSWLAGAPVARITPEDLILRYLAAFGPATVKDAQTWSGLTGLGEIADRLRPRLRTLRDDQGNELLDLPDAPRPDPDIPAEPRFLPQYDNLLASHTDRSRVISNEHRGRLMTGNSMRAAVLVDGRVAGSWYVVHHRGATTLHVEPFRRLTAVEQSGLAREGADLLAMLAKPDHTRDLQIAEPA